jgi:5'-3' exonuclease
MEKWRKMDMSKKPACGIYSDDTDIFIRVDGVNIAKRGKPGTPQAKTWISLEPGWTVTSNADISELEVSYKGTPIN